MIFKTKRRGLRKLRVLGDRLGVLGKARLGKELLEFISINNNLLVISFLECITFLY